MGWLRKSVNVNFYFKRAGTTTISINIPFTFIDPLPPSSALMRSKFSVSSILWCFWTNVATYNTLLQKAHDGRKETFTTKKGTANAQGPSKIFLFGQTKCASFSSVSADFGMLIEIVRAFTNYNRDCSVSDDKKTTTKKQSITFYVTTGGNFVKPARATLTPNAPKPLDQIFLG